MRDTELILSRLDELKEEIQGVRTELKEDIRGLRVQMEDHYAELGGRIEAVRRAVFGIKERMDVLEFVLHTEIKHTYDLALENAKQIKILMAYKDRLSGVPAV